MTTGVKICGVTTEEAVDACVASGVNWVGFVFFPRSPRCVTPARAKALARRLPATIRPVGLFVQPVAADISHVLADVPLAALQVYDTPSRVASVREGFSLETWEARAIAEARDLPATSAGDRLLVEAKPPPDASRPGGNGVALDWSILAGWEPKVPWMLAGGLTPENVADAIARSGATSVDVSSGVETAPGVKDAAAISRFVAAARGAARSP